MVLVQTVENLDWQMHLLRIIPDRSMQMTLAWSSRNILWSNIILHTVLVKLEESPSARGFYSPVRQKQITAALSGWETGTKWLAYCQLATLKIQEWGARKKSGNAQQRLHNECYQIMLTTKESKMIPHSIVLHSKQHASGIICCHVSSHVTVCKLLKRWPSRNT